MLQTWMPAIAAGISTAGNLASTAMAKSPSYNIPRGTYSSWKNPKGDDRIPFEHFQFLDNWERQKEFAKHGIRWRVEDAKAAGLHPLIGAGVNPASGQTVSVGGIDQDRAPQKTAIDWKGIGQDISNAILAIQAQTEQIDADTTRRREMMYQRLIAQSANETAGVETVPAKVTASRPGHPGIEAGFKPGYMLNPDKFGRYYINMSEIVAEAREGDWGAQMLGMAESIVERANTIENVISPYTSRAHKERQLWKRVRSLLPPPGKGKEWRFNPFYQRFEKGAKKNRFYTHVRWFIGQNGNPIKKYRIK